jgi:hypothetical protein
MDAWWTLAGGVMLASLLMVGGGSLYGPRTSCGSSRWRRRIVGRTGKGPATGA